MLGALSLILRSLGVLKEGLHSWRYRLIAFIKHPGAKHRVSIDNSLQPMLVICFETFNSLYPRPNLPLRFHVRNHR